MAQQRATLSSLEVLASGNAAGLLHRSDIEEDTFLFRYHESCPPSDAVSLTMPVVRDPYDSMSTVHPVFEMNLPEGALLEKLRALFAKVIPNFDSLALLAVVGASQVGRLRYAAPNAEPTEIPAIDLDEVLTYGGTQPLFDELLDRYATYSGISGMQPKVLLREAAAQTVSPPRLTHRGATHIVKSFDAREYPELAANEYFCLKAAHYAGIPAATARLSANRHLLAVDRFDLKEDGTYLGVEDFCVLSGLRSHGRYEGSYELVAKRIRQFVSPDAERKACERFFAMLALSCAIENGDAHLKNFAVMYGSPEGRVELAPAYDLVSTTVYRSHDVLALTLAGSKEFPTRATLLSFGQRACGLRSSRCAALVEEVERGVRRAMKDIVRLKKQDPDFSSGATQLLESFERGLRRITKAPSAVATSSRGRRPRRR